MLMISSQQIEELRSEYPVGCRIVLDRMDDPYRQIPKGTQGTVKGIDDTGSILPVWDDGGSLHVLYGEDSCHKIRSEEEIITTLNWYGRWQKTEDAICPRCGMIMQGATSRKALSRYASIMVCEQCGMEEALEQAGLTVKKELSEWTAIDKPQNGGGAWECND
mgnify:FL=1